jgi:xanthine dehydrogenase YagR molybdenum-binding subunit
MSVIETVMETVARFMPDKEHDPLLERDGFLGKPLQRVDGELKVRGQARFTAEFDFANLAHAALVYSSIAKGRIERIDTEKAKALPGVLEVLTYKNMPRLKAPPLVDTTDLKKGMAASDLPIMQDAHVHWDGEPVAVAIAETLEQAEHAASLVEIEYRAEPAETSFDALKPQAERPAAVMGEPAEIEIGDAEKALREADARIDRIYRTPRYNHNAIEPHATNALWNADGTLAVLESSQSVNTSGKTIALIFEMDTDDNQVLAPRVGGGIGGDRNTDV